MDVYRLSFREPSGNLILSGDGRSVGYTDIRLRGMRFVSRLWKVTESKVLSSVYFGMSTGVVMTSCCRGGQLVAV